jgi:ubiquinone/menaquinone biosynthesis C-methylase UbiE
MEAKLQRRVQRYGWDLAAGDYEPLWQAQLAIAQTSLLNMVGLQSGECVLDVACGTGLVSFAALNAVGAGGGVLGVDLSGQMVHAAQYRAAQRCLPNIRFERMDAEKLELPEASFDAALCALGLMYMPNPAQAVREMRRVLRPHGRMALSVWGDRSQCGWAPLFPIIDAEVTSEVCPLFFGLGQQEQLAQLCVSENFASITQRRITTTLDYADADAACSAAFVGGPVALAWSRFDDTVRARVRAKYLASIAPWRSSLGYKIPAEFVIVSAVVPENFATN